MKYFKLLWEYAKIASKSISESKLRSSLTIIIMGIGITALISISTASKSMSSSVEDAFSSMGGGLIYMYPKYQESSEIKNQRKRYLPVTYDQAVDIYREGENSGEYYVSLTKGITQSSVVLYNSIKTDPNVELIAINENYFTVNNSKIAKGRAFSQADFSNNTQTVVIGVDVADKLFGGANPIGEVVSIGSKRLEVIGVLEKMGTSQIGSYSDRVCYITLGNYIHFTSSKNDFMIELRGKNSIATSELMEKVRSVFRVIRLLKPIDADNFEMYDSSEGLTEFNEIFGSISFAIIIFGFMAIFGAAIGLMNIMLVSVAEKTREIGTRRALGASSKAIKTQYLVESILLSVYGGIFGVVFGIIIGNLVSYFMKTSFVIPWDWTILGFVICFVVGLLSGYIPAVRASKLDPIESLRYE